LLEKFALPLLTAGKLEKKFGRQFHKVIDCVEV